MKQPSLIGNQASAWEKEIQYKLWCNQEAEEWKNYRDD